MRMTADFAFGLVAVLLGLAAYITARGFPSPPGPYPGPGLFPQLLGLALAATGLALAIRGWKEGPRQPSKKPFSWRSWASHLTVIAAVLGYLAAAPRIGFLLAAFGLLAATMLCFGAPPGRALPVAAVTALSAFLLFGKALRVPLPPGPWGW